MTTPPSLEQRVAEVQQAQRLQRQRWVDEGRCGECGSDADAAPVLDGRLLCKPCAVRRSLEPRTWS